MIEIKRGFLSKKGRQWRSVRIMELAVLLFSVNRAANDPDVGFEDAAQTADGITRRLNLWRLIDPDIIESALCAANMLNEQGKFIHPSGLTFEQFVDKVLRGRGRFDTFYNLIEWSKKDDGAGTAPAGDPSPTASEAGGDADDRGT